jgi:hypothetical protein
MKVIIKYNKKKYKYLIKLNNKIFINFIIKKFIKINKLENISLIIYNYILLIKLLRIFGLIKSLNNTRDY